MHIEPHGTADPHLLSFPAAASEVSGRLGLSLRSGILTITKLLSRLQCYALYASTWTGLAGMVF